MGEEPEEKREGEAENEASHDGEIEGGVFAAVDDVAGKPAKTKREFAREIKKRAEEDKEAAEVEKHAAKIAKRIHKSIIEERPAGRRANGGL